MTTKNGSSPIISEFFPGEGDLIAIFETNVGTIKVKLFDKQAPRTVDNFVGLATGYKEWKDPKTSNMRKDPYYDGVIFHRVISGFMIQSGDRTGTGRSGPGYTFEDEFHPELKHNQGGILSMANAGPNTNGSQFFITVAPTPHLDNKHSVFGIVSEGMEVVNTIAKTSCDLMTDRPKNDIVIQKVSITRL